MVPNPGVLIAIARQRAIDLQSSSRSSRLGGRPPLGSSYRLPGGSWIRPRRESS